MHGVVFANSGHCPICERAAEFRAYSNWYRDSYICTTCHTVPRERALMSVLAAQFPAWRTLAIHESSPAERGVSAKLAKEAPGYVASHYDPSMQRGSLHAAGWRCEDLEAQTFPSESFDIVITQDVLEHLFEPELAVREIARTLRPGGAHIATTPIVAGKGGGPSRRRARRNGETVEHLFEPQYHHNPIDPNGSLVTFDWGYDIADMIDRAAPFATRIECIENADIGVLGALTEVIVSIRH
jgi:SAM-dependent methyltransferase